MHAVAAHEQALGHRPGRKAGAIVVLVDGELAVYVERGGRTALGFTEDTECLTAAFKELASAVKKNAVSSITIQRFNSVAIGTSDVVPALEDAGFSLTPRGMRVRP